MDAAYVFRVRFRLDSADVSADPEAFETVVRYPAPAPGEEGWLFFRDALWRGEVNDDRHLAGRVERWLGVPVESVAFSELATDEAYFEALKDAIAENLDAFNADDVSEVVTKYLGSSVRVE